MDHNWLIAIGLVLIVEGIGPFLFPNKWSAIMKKLADQSPAQLRQTGLLLLGIGCTILWMV